VLLLLLLAWRSHGNKSYWNYTMMGRPHHDARGRKRLISNRPVDGRTDLAGRPTAHN